MRTGLSFVQAFEQYRATLSAAIQTTLLGFRVVDAAFKVVGVGSVGLAAYVVLLATGDDEHFAIWQLKEAQRILPRGSVARGGGVRHDVGPPRSADRRGSARDAVNR